MSKTNNISIFLGSAPIGSNADATARFTTSEEAKSYLNAFAARGYNRVDSARIYPTAAHGTTEQLLGEVNAASDFVVDSKYAGYFPGCLKKEAMDKAIGETLEALKVERVNVMYLHVPDSETPLEETLETANKHYEAGKFKSFGISNYSAEEVEKIFELCTKNNWVKPTVYQGQYNAILRNSAEQLLPVLRKYGAQFAAFSPAAGGFFSGLEYGRPGSRFEPVTPMGQGYNSMYGKDEMKKLAAMLVEKAKTEGITGHSAALRWIIHHSQLQNDDAVVIAASSVEQLNDNIDALEVGPLPETLVKLFDEVWEKAGKQ